MIVNTLKLTNFRGIQDLSLDFDPRLNVFAGVNGAGKTTILDAVAAPLWTAINSFSESRIRPPEFEKNIKNGCFSCKVEAAVNIFDEEETWFVNANQDKEKTFPGKTIEETEANRYEPLISSNLSNRYQRRVQDGKPDLPLIVYYPVNRTVTKVDLNIDDIFSFDILTGYDDALDADTNFNRFFQWYRHREDYENEKIRDISEYRYTDNQLLAVGQAVHKFLPDWNGIRIRRNPLDMQVDKNFERYSIMQLSDGEKCLFAMIADIARRLAILNPSLDNPLEGCGVILIDEIELHLHPVWQQSIIPKLLDTFPNCQFFISTHSPQVLTNVEPEKLWIMEPEPIDNEQGKGAGKVITARHPENSFGWTSDLILQDTMGLKSARQSEIQEALDGLFLSIDKLELDKATQQIRDIRKKAGDLPELTRAQALIFRKEKLGR